MIVVSADATQVGCMMEDKDKLSTALCEATETIPKPGGERESQREKERERVRGRERGREWRSGQTSKFNTEYEACWRIEQ